MRAPLATFKEGEALHIATSREAAAAIRAELAQARLCDKRRGAKN